MGAGACGGVFLGVDVLLCCSGLLRVLWRVVAGRGYKEQGTLFCGQISWVILYCCCVAAYYYVCGGWWMAILLYCFCFEIFKEDRDEQRPLI